MTVKAGAVLDALGDSRRRMILERLAGGPLAVGVLANQLPITRSAVSQHLKVLKRADLVTESTVGTRHFYGVNPAGLEVLRTYLERFWTTTLDNFAALAEVEAQQRRATAPPVDEPEK